MQEILDSYINGQHKQASKQLRDSSYSFVELFEYYLETYDSNHYDIILFVRRMAV